MIIKMMPVCECGYVFKDLSYTNLGYNERGGVIGSINYRFSPSCCPNCYKIIKGLEYQIPPRNKFNFVDGNFIKCEEDY